MRFPTISRRPDIRPIRYAERWPADLHVIGKDITRFHSIIWPAMLMAAGLELPRQVWAHGFVLLAGDRFSKSAGVRLDLDEAIDEYGPMRSGIS